MAVVHKSVLLNYSAEQMFALVDKVEDYPAFLPWCGGVDVRERAADKLVAAIQINYHGVKQSFTTQNTHVPPTRMQMTLVEGPFSQLDGTWQFTPLRDDACKVTLHLAFRMRNGLAGRAARKLFDSMANTLVDALCRRAREVYGSG